MSAFADARAAAQWMDEAARMAAIASDSLHTFATSLLSLHDKIEAARAKLAAATETTGSRVGDMLTQHADANLVTALELSAMALGMSQQVDELKTRVTTDAPVIRAWSTALGK